MLHEELPPFKSSYLQIVGSLRVQVAQQHEFVSVNAHELALYVHCINVLLLPFLPFFLHLLLGCER